MELWVLDTEFNTVSVVDDYTSCIWSNRYNEIGDCEVYIEANSHTLSTLRKGYYLVRDNDDMICRIEKVELDTDNENGNFLVVTGVDCKKILNQRLVWNQTNYDGFAQGFIGVIFTENVSHPADNKRKIDNFRMISNPDLPNVRINIQCTYDYVFDKIKEVCTRFGWGSKVTFDGTNFNLKIYEGVNRSVEQYENNCVIFSPEFENLHTTKYETDISNIKTSALIAGEGEGVAREKAVIDEGSGLERFELYVDARDVSTQTSFTDLKKRYPNGVMLVQGSIVYWIDTTTGAAVATLDNVDDPQTATLIDEAYTTLLLERGREKLAECVLTEVFDGDVEPNYSYQYGVDYFLGDIVTVRNEYGIEVNARITEVIEKDDENGYSIIPTFEFVVQDIESTEEYLLTETNDILTTENDEPLRY